MFCALFVLIVFALWLNSLDVDPFVNNLYTDLQDGTILLQAFDKMHPGIVDWKRASRRQPLNRFKQVENTNYAIMIGQHLRYTLVNMQGADIVDGSPTLTLGLVWQMMRENVTQTMKKLSKSGRDITDMEMIRWANEAVQRGDKTSKVSSFKDSSFRTGVFVCDVLNGIRPGSIDYAMVSRGTTLEDAKLNAKYAISVARKIGAVIFVLPEDIIECRAKLVSTLVFISSYSVSYDRLFFFAHIFLSCLDPNIHWLPDGHRCYQPCLIKELFLFVCLFAFYYYTNYFEVSRSNTWQEWRVGERQGVLQNQHTEVASSRLWNSLSFSLSPQ